MDQAAHVPLPKTIDAGYPTEFVVTRRVWLFRDTCIIDLLPICRVLRIDMGLPMQEKAPNVNYQEEWHSLVHLWRATVHPGRCVRLHLGTTLQDVVKREPARKDTVQNAVLGHAG